MKELVDKIPWRKITAPMIPLILVDVYLGWFLIKMHTLNLTHGVIDRFPTDKTLYIFLGGNFFIVFVYLGISALGQVIQEKINYKRAEIELDFTNQM